MSALQAPNLLSPAIIYPDSDGKRMADNTKQALWIVVLWGNLTAMFREMAKVFVAMDHLWYPVKGEPEIRAAPDVYVVFGRPKGHRGSYKQWEEAGIAPQVAFEILSPGNDTMEMIEKQLFYEEYGVQEYYVYDPEKDVLVAYLREGDMLRPRRVRTTLVSPLLQIRFDLTGEEMVVFYPDGRRFLTFEDMEAERFSAVEAEKHARQHADEALKQADEARQRADRAEQRSRRVVELSRKARAGQASAAELQELEQLESELSP